MDNQGSAAVQQQKDGGVSTRTARRVIIVVLVVAAVAVGYFYLDNQKYAKADAAIESVMDACSTSNRFLIAQKVVEAKKAFRELPDVDAVAYDTKLASRMNFMVCSAH
jgi:hypothetical protein